MRYLPSCCLCCSILAFKKCPHPPRPLTGLSPVYLPCVIHPFRCPYTPPFHFPTAHHTTPPLHHNLPYTTPYKAAAALTLLLLLLLVRLPTVQAVTYQQQQQPAQQYLGPSQEQYQQQEQWQADPQQQLQQQPGQQQLQQWQQQPIPPQQVQQQQWPRNADQQLLHAIKNVPSYPLLAALVRMQCNDDFKPHHTAAAVLRLAQLMQDSNRGVQGTPGMLNPAVGVSSMDAYDSYDGGECSGPGRLDAPHLHGLSGSSSSSSSGGTGSSSSSSSSGEEVGQSWQGAGSNAGGYGYVSSMQQQVMSARLPYSSSRIMGLAGLIPSAAIGAGAAGDGMQRQQLPPILRSGGSNGSSSDNSTAAELEAGLLNSATMAARMAAVRQQRAEQAALVRGRLLLPMQLQWQQQPSLPVRQQQQEVNCDALLGQLLSKVVQQSGGMSASSGLSVLTALTMLKLKHK